MTPQKKHGTVDFLGLCSDQHLFFTLLDTPSFPHYNNKIIKFGWKPFYFMEVWGAACKTFINPILILQKRMARVITFKDRKHHSNPLFLELNLLDVFKEYIDI